MNCKRLIDFLEKIPGPVLGVGGGILFLVIIFFVLLPSIDWAISGNEIDPSEYNNIKNLSGNDYLRGPITNAMKDGIITVSEYNDIYALFEKNKSRDEKSDVSKIKHDLTNLTSVKPTETEANGWETTPEAEKAGNKEISTSQYTTILNIANIARYANDDELKKMVSDAMEDDIVTESEYDEIYGEYERRSAEKAEEELEETKNEIKATSEDK